MIFPPQSHLAKKGIEAVLVTGDVANRKSAQEMGLHAVSLKSYVGQFKDGSVASLLVDRLAAAHSADSDKPLHDNRAEKKDLFPTHLAPQDINAGIKSGKLMQGSFFLSHTNYREATIHTDAYDKPILVQGLYNQNRAVNGDTVAIQLFDKSQWTSASELVAEQGSNDAGDVLEDEEGGKRVDESKLQPTGRVVGIIKRKWRQYCGMLVPASGGTRHIFVPAEKKIPKVRIETRQAETLRGKRIVVAVDAWPRHSRYPVGHFVRVLGKSSHSPRHYLIKSRNL